MPLKSWTQHKLCSTQPTILLHHISSFGLFSFYCIILWLHFALSNTNFRSSTLNKFTVGNLLFPSTQPMASHTVSTVLWATAQLLCGKTAYTLKVHSWQPQAFTVGPHLFSLIDSEQYKKKTLLHEFGKKGHLRKFKL